MENAMNHVILKNVNMMVGSVRYNVLLLYVHNVMSYIMRIMKK